MVKKYLLEEDNEFWKAFRICAALQGLKIREAVDCALRDYVKAHENTQVRIDFKVVENRKENLLTIIYETELKSLIEAAVRSKKNNAPRQYMDQLKDRMLEIVKKHPTMTKDLADEVVQVFKTLT